MTADAARPAVHPTGSPNPVPISILDLVGVPTGVSVASAIRASVRAARAADEEGFTRYWFAEHHNTPTFASSATSILIGHVLSATSRIRVGAGGVMLPNHAPLVVAEQYGTLRQLHGDRVDLGLGRAPGTDQLTAQQLHRGNADPQAFLAQVADLQCYFSDQGRSAFLPVRSIVAQGTHVPIWVLGSTVNGAMLAASLGLPFAFASHFAPDQLADALAVYRDRFDPGAATAQLDAPYAAIGVNVVVADSDTEAERLFTTQQQMVAALRSGQPPALLPPVESLEDAIGPRLAALARSHTSTNAVGDSDTVREGLRALVARTGADELIAVSYAHDVDRRVDTIRGLAHAWGLSGAMGHVST